MNTATLIESNARIGKHEALTIAAFCLEKMELQYDSKVGFVATLDRKHHSGPLIWTVLYHNSPNPFGFAQERNYIEIDAENGNLVAILTPRGDLVKRRLEHF